MMEKIKAGEITGQTGDYMLRATAANGQIRAFAATSRDLVEKPDRRTIPARWRPQRWDA